MTAIPHPLHSVGHDAAHADHGHAHHEIGFVKKYIFSVDHKIIGLQFLFLGLMFFVIGGLEAMLVRWQLGWPGRAAAGAWPWGWRIIAQSTGVRVRATTPDSTIDVAIVMPNWR